ncbi:hypothetical protein POVCU1_023900 [Plasmodium ovale curtisi]|uniref:Uncharacterized protein n=1 Tax=Plasmodium ovale curtisi TaxID=864141 RepID=A0A1A8WIG9_PLAOA|nr:hypothetical protein POVCU1_023900 [Plasmodium ovale curtisi]
MGKTIKGDTTRECPNDDAALSLFQICMCVARMGFFVLSSSPTPNNVPCPYGGTENEERENMGRGIYLFDLIRSAIFYRTVKVFREKEGTYAKYTSTYEYIFNYVEEV